jgi:hypothetical protein
MSKLPPKSTFSSIDDFASKFIGINGNPSILYVIDCTRTHDSMVETKEVYFKNGYQETS